MREQCIFAGFGGQGMLLIGTFLAEAAMRAGKHVSWLPSYGPEMRGGTANCSVVISDKPVASPMVTAPDTVIAMNLPSMRKFEDIVKPGGLLIVNSSIVEEKCPRDDIEVVYIPANEIAAKVKNPRGANVAIFGAYVAKKLGVASKENILEAIRISLGEEKARFFEGNVRALEAGIEFTKNLNK